MIGTKTVRATAGHPELPLERVTVVKGSALSLGVLDAPRTRFGVTVSGVSVAIENASGVALAVSATAEGNVWTATFPATHFAATGFVASGVTVTATGKDENETARSWVIGVGDLEVLDADASPSPGESVERITTKTFDGETVSLQTEDDMYNGLKKILVKLGATVALFAACLTAHALPPEGYTNDTYTADGVTWTRHGALNTRKGYVVTDTSAGGGSGAPNYAAVSNAAMTAVQPETMTNYVAGATNAITATSIGALPITGGTLTGDLTVETYAHYEDAGVINVGHGGNLPGIVNVRGNGGSITLRAGGHEQAAILTVGGTNVIDELNSKVSYAQPRLVALTGDVVTATNLAGAAATQMLTAEGVTNAANAAISTADTTYTMTNAVVDLNQSVQSVSVASGQSLTILAPSGTGTRDWCVYANCATNTPLVLPAGQYYASDEAFTNELSAGVTALYFTSCGWGTVIGRQELKPVTVAE